MLIDLMLSIGPGSNVLPVEILEGGDDGHGRFELIDWTAHPDALEVIDAFALTEEIERLIAEEVNKFWKKCT